MRTTLTLDNDVAAKLKEIAYQSGRSFKEVVNSTLRAGIDAGASAPKKRYKLSAVSMGPAQAGLDLNKALRIASILEDEEVQRKMELRK